MYIVPFIATFWTAGVAVLCADAKYSCCGPSKKMDGGGQRDKRTIRSQITDVVSNPVLLSAAVGMIIGLVKPVQDALFADGAPLLFISSTLKTLGKPVVPLSALLMSVSLGSFYDKLQKRRHAARKATDVTMAVNPVATFDADTESGNLGHGRSQGSRSTSYSEATIDTSYSEAILDTVVDDSTATATAAPTATAAAAAAAAATTVHPDLQFTAIVINQPPETPVSKKEKMSTRTMITLVVVRTFLLPAINMALVICFADDILADGPDRDIIKLILMIESAVPSAEMVIIMSQQNGQFEVAESLAVTYLFQYGLGMLPLGAAIAMSLNMFEF